MVIHMYMSVSFQLKLSVALSELGSADHCSRPEILHVRRPFLLTGTCMFYKVGDPGAWSQNINQLT